MQEIVFSDSIDKTKQYIQCLQRSDTRYGHCNTCGKSSNGIYRLVEGDFICVNCLARNYFEYLVGKACE